MILSFDKLLLFCDKVSRKILYNHDKGIFSRKIKIIFMEVLFMESRKSLAKKGFISIIIFIATIFLTCIIDTESALEYVNAFVMLFSWITAGVSLYKLDVMKNKAALVCLIIFLNFLYLFYAGFFILLPMLNENKEN